MYISNNELNDYDIMLLYSAIAYKTITWCQDGSCVQVGDTVGFVEEYDRHLGLHSSWIKYCLLAGIYHPDDDKEEGGGGTE
jgi:hypothetical protein